MYRDAYQRGMLTVFFSGGSKPLAVWETKTRDGYIKRFLDPEIKTMVLEIRGNNISTTYMTCPKGNQVLGITMPFLVMVVKNLMKYFSFEVTVLDSTGTRRRFRVSNFQSTTQILPLCTVMPIGLATGWNQIQFNLAEFTRRAYKNQFVEVQRLKINANIRLRRIYFTEKLMSDDELPAEYKLYFPLQQKGPKPVKGLETDKDPIKTPQDEVQEKKLSEDLTKTASASTVKKRQKSLQTMSVPEEAQKDQAAPADTTATETKVEKKGPQEEPATEKGHVKPDTEESGEKEQNTEGKPETKEKKGDTEGEGGHKEKGNEEKKTEEATDKNEEQTKPAEEPNEGKSEGKPNKAEGEGKPNETEAEGKPDEAAAPAL